MTTPPDTSEIAQQLETLSVVELNSVRVGDELLLALVSDGSISLLARLHASEVLLRRDRATFLSVIGAAKVATIYVAALKNQVTIDLNPWAFLSFDELGPFGQTLVACGESAIAELVPLLPIQRLAGLYSGSAEAKEGNADQPRVCDFAAFFISRIKQLPFRFHRDDFTLRNVEIDRVKRLV